MTNQDINKYIKIYQQTNDEDAFKKLMNQYRNMIYGIIKHYEYNVLNSKEDLYQVASISMIKALRTFDIDKDIKFSTYLVRIIKNDINVLYRKSKKRDAIVNSIDEVIPGNEKGETVKDSLKSSVDIEYQLVDDEVAQIYMILDEYKKENKQKKGEILDMILKDDMDYKTIAKLYGYKGKSRIDAIFKEFSIYAKEKILEMNN